MPELGPRTLKAIAEGPQTKTVFVATSRGGLETAERKEPLRAFARRVALIAVEEERERCATIADELGGVPPEDWQKIGAAIREGR